MKPLDLHRDLGSAKRLDLIKAAARPPVECGPDIIAAPARGPCIAFQPVEMRPKGERDWQAVPVGYGGRSAVRAMDVFDRMLTQARRRKEPMPLTPAQVSIARHYRALVERHDAGGTKLSQIDGGRRGDGAGRDFMDAYIAQGREIEALRRRCGPGLAARCLRPSRRGSRSSILDRTLIDMVCLKDQPIDQVLRAHGWSVKGDTRKALRKALCAALDRMIGYR
ncbi:MAG: hypothetical protein ACK5IP_22340 [Paracoccus sp. (in: a-proteobacteria)]